jgi:hypothetical protein
MIANTERIGRFTSSEIHRLMSNGRKAGEPGAPFYSYIAEKEAERKLGRSLYTGGAGQSAAWGNLMEMYVYNELIKGHYFAKGKQTYIHPTHNFWAGSADLVQTGVKVGDIKCYYPKNFVQFADVLMQKDVDVFKKEYGAEYWQLVSNASIHKVKRAEMILFMPYNSRLNKIRQWMETDDATTQEAWRYRFIFEGEDETLPFVPDECEHYTELVTFEFEVPQEDFDALESRVLMAESMIKTKLK